eukprot:g17812.t1
MELKCEGGRVYLTPADGEVVLDAKERAYDFTVLPQVTKHLNGQRRKSGRLLHLDPICYDFSQLLNGKVIKEKMNAKDNRDIDYVVTAYEINTNRVFSPPQYQGNSMLVRWGEETTPEFLPEDSSLWSLTKGDFTVARIYFEKTTTAHEKMQLCASEGKSGSVIIDEKTAERMGFESYYVPSVKAEVAAVVSHNIFGETKMRSEVKDKNIITSRLVVVIKVDLTTGKAQRVKSRWVSRGFEDRRFGKNQATQLDCRSFTMSDSSFLMLLQFCQATDSGVWFGDVKEAFLKGMRFDEAYGEDYLKDKNSKVWMTVPKVIQGMEEYGLKELVELVKAIYGRKDAPLCWQRTFHNELRTLGFQQSLIDPCLWTVFATRKEVEVLKQGEEAVKKYFWEKAAEIEALPKHDNAKCREILCGQGDKQQQQLPQHDGDDGKEIPEKDLQEAETKYNITRATEPTEYTKSPELKFTAQVLFDGHKMTEDVAYLRLLMSELLFLYQLALDLHLINLDASVLQLVDSKNCTTEPKEKNLRVDYMALAQLREEGFLQIKHVPGKLNWSDALTKSVREVQIFLLYLSTVWGITDKKIVDVVKLFAEKQKTKFAKTAEGDDDEAEFSDDEDDNVEESVALGNSRVAVKALLTEGTNKKKDEVIEDDKNGPQLTKYYTAEEEKERSSDVSLTQAERKIVTFEPYQTQNFWP